MSFEIPSAFGYLDSDFYTNGSPGSAALRREIERNHNRLVAGGDFSLIYGCAYPSPDSASSDELASHVIGFGTPWWVRIEGPYDCPKKPDLIRAMAQAIIRISEEDIFQFGIETIATGWDPNVPVNVNPQPPHVRELRGSGPGHNLIETFMDNLPVQRSEGERIKFWIRGGMTDRAMDAGYGAQTGTVSNATRGWRSHFFSTAAPAWTAALPTDGHYVTFSGLPGEYIIIGVDTTNQALFIHPHAPSPLEGRTYNIYARGQYQLASVSIYGKNRTR